MFQTTMITAALDVERRTQIADQRRKELRYEPYVNYLAPVQTPTGERRSLWARVVSLVRNIQLAWVNNPSRPGRYVQVGKA